MRYSFLFVLIVLNSIILSAQRKDETRFIKNAGEVLYSFNDVHFDYSFQLPFKQIKVVDKRFDSSKAGYTLENISNKYSKIVLEKEWSGTLNNYFKSNLDTGAKHTLVIIVQSFWLQSGTLAEIQRIKKVKGIYKDYNDRGGTCAAELDVYVESDSTLQALFRIDTSFLGLGNFNKNNVDKFFFLPFDSIAKKINTLPITQSILNKRKISWGEINSVYDRRFQIPILNEESPTTGVYVNFHDFLSNKPLIGEFKIKKGKLTDQLYSIKNGKEELLDKYWGFSDTSGLYISIGMNFFKAIRRQNTFEVVGFRHINVDRDYQGGALYAEPLLGKLFTNKTLKIFQVNMKTGNVQ